MRTPESKIVSPDSLLEDMALWDRPLVFTNGCFDLLHRGHVSYLAQAKLLGATLLVALNSDASIQRLGKGLDRPIQPLEDRMVVMAALESVDRVTCFDTDTPLPLINALRPEVLVKGGDWPEDAIVGAAEVRGWGGQVQSIPFQFERSTSSIISKIRRV